MGSDGKHSFTLFTCAATALEWYIVDWLKTVIETNEGDFSEQTFIS